jgi:hypothetical protein
LNYQLNKSQNFLMNSAKKTPRRPSEPKAAHLPAHGHSLGNLDDAGTPICGRRVKHCLGDPPWQLHSFRVATPPVVH